MHARARAFLERVRTYGAVARDSLRRARLTAMSPASLWGIDFTRAPHARRMGRLLRGPDADHRLEQA